MNNSDKIILDLCGGTGSWSAPYRSAGYDVRIITYPKYDVRTFEPPQNVYGVLAAPPCTDFSIACSRLWKLKDEDGRTAASLEIVYACLDIINKCNPKFWALENPIGRLKDYIGKPKEIYCYSQFGCDYQKKVCLWGEFIPPFRIFSGADDLPGLDCADKLFHDLPIGYQAAHSRRAARRSVTYPGFANAFYEFNN